MTRLVLLAFTVLTVLSELLLSVFSPTVQVPSGKVFSQAVVSMASVFSLLVWLSPSHGLLLL